MKVFIALGHLLFGKMPFCSRIGGFVGLVAGFFLAMTLDALPPGGLSPGDILSVGLRLALAGWVVVMMVYGIWLRYGPVAIWLPSAVIAIVTGLLTVMVNTFLHAPALAVPVGLIIGLLVGLVLCASCWRSPITRRSSTHAR